MKMIATPNELASLISFERVGLKSGIRSATTHNHSFQSDFGVSRC